MVGLWADQSRVERREWEANLNEKPTCSAKAERSSQRASFRPHTYYMNCDLGEPKTHATSTSNRSGSGVSRDSHTLDGCDPDNPPSTAVPRWSCGTPRCCMTRIFHHHGPDHTRLAWAAERRRAPRIVCRLPVVGTKTGRDSRAAQRCPMIETRCLSTLRDRESAV